jgi:hypothetical protein
LHIFEARFDALLFMSLIEQCADVLMAVGGKSRLRHFESIERWATTGQSMSSVLMVTFDDENRGHLG